MDWNPPTEQGAALRDEVMTNTSPEMNRLAHKALQTFPCSNAGAEMDSDSCWATRDSHIMANFSWYRCCLLLLHFCERGRGKRWTQIFTMVLTHFRVCWCFLVHLGWDQSIQAEGCDYLLVAFPLCCTEQKLNMEKNLSSEFLTRAV